MVKTRSSIDAGNVSEEEPTASSSNQFIRPTSSRRTRDRRYERPRHSKRRRRYSLNGDDRSHCQANGQQSSDSQDEEMSKSPTEQYDHQTRRKSMRQRKETYCSLNENLIVKTAVARPDGSDIDDRNQNDAEDGAECIYDVVKRHKRRSNTDDAGDCPAQKTDDSEQSEADEHDDESQKCYFLRQNKPVTKRYAAPAVTLGRARKKSDSYFAIASGHDRHASTRKIPQHSSPYHSKKKLFGRQVRNGGSSTSSSDESGDEQKFKRRKAKSMLRARNRCLPLNFKANDIVGVLKDRGRARVRPNVGGSLADIDPMSIDSKVTFESVGGLQSHVRSLKEMVVFPLLYPEVFEKFKITAPRGVLFHGPPGTGKTLLARALANECSVGNQKVAFFMRKGADCLSKWVGESERQLRLLFDQAYTMRPSIIFFDEIDGLAPVRSTRQDQIHSSIVSTLLALMDGLDARGEVVVIGATNRVDAIDPALRRPGRFDREFMFSLPNQLARQKILEIHTAEWNPQLSEAFICELSEECAGYCGADLKALCTETILCALRRRYPQIYKTSKKLLLDLNNIKVSIVDFQAAMHTIVPASQRAIASPAKGLPHHFKPLLGEVLERCIHTLAKMFPPSSHPQSDETTTDVKENNPELEERNDVSIFAPQAVGRSTRNTQRLSSPLPGLQDNEKYLSFLFKPHHSQPVFRPRFLLTAAGNMGQQSHLAPALLHHMDHLNAQVLDLPFVFGMSSRTPEEACFQVFREARRTQPSVLYMPDIDVWWNAVPETTKSTLMFLLNDLPPSCPVLLLATSTEESCDLPKQLKDMFCNSQDQLFVVPSPQKEGRLMFFQDLFLKFALEVERQPTAKAAIEVEVLPVAPAPQPRQLSANEVSALREEEQNTLRELRLFLRHICWKLLADRKFKEFSKPVDLEEVPDYHIVIRQPMDLSTIMTKINSHCYITCAEFLYDVDLITSNCLEYNPDKEQVDRHLRNRACELRDTAHALVYSELDPEFDKSCTEIQESRKKRGETTEGTAPPYLKVAPRNLASDSSPPKVEQSSPTGQRTTRRSLKLRGEEAPDIPYIRNSIEYSMRLSLRKEIPQISGDVNMTAEDEEQCSSSGEGPSHVICCDQTDTVTVENNEQDDALAIIPLPSQPYGENNESVSIEGLRDAMTDLLQRLVACTERASLEQLEQTYNALCSILFQHRRDSSKAELQKELMSFIESIES